MLGFIKKVTEDEKCSCSEGVSTLHTLHNWGDAYTTVCQFER